MLKKITVLVSGLFVAHLAHASGYHFGTQSVTAQSTANSSAAEAADATTIFSNPAGLAKLDSDQITASLNLVAPHIKYSDAKATYRRGGEVQGENSGKITKDVVAAPHIYGAHKINDDVTVGLGVYVPFASSTEYSENSVLRHHLNQLGLTTVAVEPVVSFKINPQHAVGVGAIAQYSTAELRKYADWDASGTITGLARQQAQEAGVPAAALSQINATGKADGRAKVKGNDWGFGYQLGWLWDINDQTRVGVNYRSKVEHNLEGTAEWTPEGSLVANPRVSPLIQARGYVPHEKASVKIVTPESLSVHGMYKATDKLNLFGDVTWTRHSRFNRAELVFENAKAIGLNANGRPQFSDRTIITPNWRNTYKVAFGGSYQYSEPLQLRAGIAFDQSPVRGASSRLNTLPDGNRIWYSVGAKYQPAKNHIFDVAYSHIHINDTTFSAAASTGNDVDSKGTGSAKFNNYANIVGLQYTYKF